MAAVRHFDFFSKIDTFSLFVSYWTHLTTRTRLKFCSFEIFTANREDEFEILFVSTFSSTLRVRIVKNCRWGVDIQWRNYARSAREANFSQAPQGMSKL